MAVKKQCRVAFAEGQAPRFLCPPRSDEQETRQNSFHLRCQEAAQEIRFCREVQKLSITLWRMH